MINLWVCFPNNSGSNYVHRLVGSHKNALNSVPIQNIVSRLDLGPRSESQIWTLRPDLYCLPSLYNWGEIKKVMYARWSMSPVFESDATVVDASQYTLAVVYQLNTLFKNSIFIFGIRHPYCFALSENAYDPLLMIRHWLRVAEYQIYNRTSTAINSPKILIRYEDLGSKTTLCMLDNFLKDNSTIRIIETVENFKNGNEKHFEFLNGKPKLIKKMNKLLTAREDLLEFFEYELL